MYLDEYKRWMAADLEDADLKPELAKIEGNDAEIKDRFAVALKFGTAGLRGVLGAGTNRMNIYVVRQATQGLANWVKTQGGTQTVAISYDSRIKSDVFAKTAAGVLAANGIQVRIYDADQFATVSEVPAGQVCAVTGLSHVQPGSPLGAEPEGERPVLAPVLSYQVLMGDADVPTVVRALRELADEDPLLGVTWHEHLQEVHVQLMGAVQREVLQETLAERFGLAVDFGPGGILYRETVTEAFEGIGHFEPLRHYAEAHLLIEPLERGAGVETGTRASEDDLDRNWQRLILTHVLEREHLGVLTGSPLTDVRITLLGGKAHAKHTEGGDFRQATYRALRQGLMRAREAGACVLLEPWYRFRLAVPADKIGRALADAQRMGAEFDPPRIDGDRAVLEGAAPAAEMRSYGLEVSGYSGGRGRLALEYDGYRPCHNADEVIEQAAYDPEADLANTPDSVFCSHGAGYTVKWFDVPEKAHVTIDPARLRPWRAADAAFFSAGAR